jgi:hypothetical protein
VNNTNYLDSTKKGFEIAALSLSLLRDSDLVFDVTQQINNVCKLQCNTQVQPLVPGTAEEEQRMLREQLKEVN